MGTSRSDELPALAQRVADALPPEAIEVVLTGSVSRGVADEFSDIEMPLVTSKRDPLRAMLVMCELQVDTADLAPPGPNIVRARRWLQEVGAVLREAGDSRTDTSAF